MSSRREVLAAGATIATGLVAGCSTKTKEPTAASVEVAAADVPVGGGVVLGDSGYVITQPTAGEYAAFTAYCTHQQCLVSRVDAEGIFCACHGSLFDSTTGDVKQGPATTALKEATVTVDGDTLIVAA